MKQKSSFKVVTIFKVYSRISGAVACAVGFIILCGWIFDIPLLKSLHPALVSMKANTAIAIILAGVSLWFFHTPRKSSLNTLIVSFCTALVAAIGLLTLIEYIGDWNFGIDQLIFNEPNGTIGTFFPGRMAFSAALCFLCLGIALLLARSEATTPFILSQLLNLTAGFITLIALAGYLYDVEKFYSNIYLSQMAVHTAFTLLVLSIGILCAVPNRGIMAVISGNNVGAFLARRLLPATFIIPILIGWLRLEGERHEFFGSAFGVLIVAVIYIILFMLLVWVVARSLNRYDFERKQAEEKKLQLASIIESSDDAIISKTLDGIIKSWNSGAEKMYGYTREQVINQSISIIIPPDHHDEMKQMLDKIRGGEHIDNFETVRLRKDGVQINVSVSISPVYNVEKILIGASTIARDITERIRVEEKLRKLSRGVEQSPASIVITDTDGAIEYVNPKFVQITGYSLEEAIGKNPRILKTGETPAEEYKRLWEIITSGGEWKGEFHNKKKNGELYWESAVISPIIDVRGNITHFIAVKEDITQRKQVEESLHQSEEKFRAIFESNSSAIAIIEIDTTISMVNDAYCQMSGYLKEEVIGMSWTQQIPPDDLERLKEYNRRRLINPQDAPEKYEFKFYNRAGEIRHALMSVALMPSIRKIITSFVDITDRKNAEVEREKLIDDLQAAMAEVKTLSGLIPICSSCKKIRDDKGYWNILEAYLIEHSDAQFTHGICPECAALLYPNIELSKKQRREGQ